MSDSVGRVDLDLGLNYKQFNNQLSGIAGNATNMVGGAFKKLGFIIAAAFAVKEMVGFGRESIKLASDLNEVQNVVDVTFGSMAQNVNDFSKTALASFGLSELSAKKYASTMGAMLKSSGLTGGSVVKLSEDMTGLAADMASFYNLSQDMAFDKIRSGISGETEPLKQLGINMSVANLEAYALAQGITKQYSAMTQAEQVLLRYNYLMTVSKDAQGDFARTSTGWANQTRLLSEQWKIFQGTMGQGFINILAPVLHGLNVLITKLQIAATYFKAFTEMIFGAQKTTGSGTAAVSGLGTAAVDAGGAMGGMGSATSGAGKAAKKAGKDVKGSLSSFDQLNIIGNDAAAALDDAAGGMGDLGAASGGIVDIGTLGTPKIEAPDMTAFKPVLDFFTQVKEAASQVGTFLSNAFGPPLLQALSMIQAPLLAWKQTLWDTFNQISGLGEPLKQWFTTGLIPMIQSLIVTWGLAMATFLDVTRKGFEGMRTVIMPIISWLITDGLPQISTWFVADFIPLLQKAITTVGEILNGLIDTAVMVFSGIRDAAMPIIQWFVSNGLPLLTSFASGAIDVFKSIFDAAKLIFDILWSQGVQPGLMLVSHMVVDMLNILKKFWDTFGKDIIDGLKTAFNGIANLFKTLWDSFLGPIWNNMLTTMKWLWDNHLKGLIDQVTIFIGKLVTGALEILNKFIIPLVNFLVKILGPTFSNIFSFIGDVLGTFIGVVVDIAKSVFKILGGIIDFIVGVFTGNWEKAWQGVKDIFGGLFDGIVAILKGSLNLIIDAVNFMIRGLNKIKIDAPDWVEKLTGYKSFGINIPEIPKLAQGGMVSSPTLAMVGDNKNAAVDPEVVSPLSKLSAMLSASNQGVIEALMMILDVLERLDLSIDIDGEKLTRIVREKLRVENNRVGTSTVTVGGVPLR